MVRIGVGLFLFFLLLSCGGGPDSSLPESGRDGSGAVVSGAEAPGPAFGQAEARPTVLVLGGTFSIARGLDPGQAYAAQLQALLLEKGSPLKVLNASISGETAAGAAERLPSLLEHPLEQVILELGQADEAKKTDVSAFTRDVNKLLRGIHTRYPEAPILLLPSARKKNYMQAISEATDGLEGVAVSNLLLDAGPAVRPDDAGLHRRMAEALFLAMEQAGR